MTLIKNDDSTQQTKTLFQIFESEVVQRINHIYISDDLQEPGLYIELIHCILSAAEGDLIYLHLNLDGGRLDTGIQIINAIRNTAGHVVTCLESKAHSMASMIFLAGHEYIVNDKCLMLIHNYSTGVSGKGHELQANVEATARWFKESAASIYFGFLTEGEIKRIFKGEDFWFHAEDVRERLKKMIDIRQNQKEENANDQESNNQ